MNSNLEKYLTQCYYEGAVVTSMTMLDSTLYIIELYDMGKEWYVLIEETIDEEFALVNLTGNALKTFRKILEQNKENQNESG